MTEGKAELTIYNLKIEGRNVTLVGNDVNEQVAILSDHIYSFESVGRFKKSKSNLKISVTFN